MKERFLLPVNTADGAGAGSAVADGFTSLEVTAVSTLGAAFGAGLALRLAKLDAHDGLAMSGGGGSDALDFPALTAFCALVRVGSGDPGGPRAGARVARCLDIAAVRVVNRFSAVFAVSAMTHSTPGIVRRETGENERVRVSQNRLFIVHFSKYLESEQASQIPQAHR